MTTTQTQRHRGPHPVSLMVYFLTASLLLYLGIGIGLLSPTTPDESRLARLTPPLFFISVAALLVLRTAWILRRPESPQSRGRGLKLTIPLSLAVVIVGCLLISLAIFREHWVELFWERWLIR